MPISFPSTGELLDHLRREKKKGERFATRFILIQGCDTWDDLIVKLNYEVEKTVCLSHYCSGADVFPDNERLKAHLESSAGGFNNVLLTPLAEHIRIDPEAAELIGWLAQYPSDKINRIYVPLLEVEGLFWSAISRICRYHEGLLPDIWSLQGAGRCEIVVAPFQIKTKGINIVQGLQEYFARWSSQSIRKAWLVSQMAPWLSVPLGSQNYHIRTYASCFDYVRQTMRGVQLCKEWGSPKEWEWLARQVDQDIDLDSLAARLLKVVEYDSNRLFYMWKGVGPKERWLIWLWSKVSSEPGTYLHHIMQSHSNRAHFHEHATTGIFDYTMPPPVAICRERKQLLLYSDIKFMPQRFWHSYKSLKEPLHRLSVLTDISQQQRLEAIACVGELIKKDIDPNQWWEYLECAFPALAWYLQPIATGDEFADRYFQAYTRCRIKDTADTQLSDLINQWAKKQLLWNYPSRSELVSRLREEGAKVIWVDGMGIEWMGLLRQYFFANNEADCDITITRSNLPTTTEANKEWHSREMIERGLDDAAHHYDYSFPQSFLTCMEVVKKVATKALSLLAQHSCVVITADHGLSRFAVKGATRTEVPNSIEAEAAGRFASIENDSYHIGSHCPLIMDRGHVIWMTHEGFKSAGSCRGEVHGGATPEECLVPVIVLRPRSKQLAQTLKYDLLTPVVKLSMAHVGLLRIRIDKSVDTKIELRAAGRQLVSQPDGEQILTYRFQGWSPGRYTGRLFYHGRLMGEIEFEIVRGILEQDLGL
ncbi:MAG: BREX-4 system phosphatase PglZ [Bacteroidales bacterium]|nr:BREX-4 system phosphatase PglZ [Bacteroidales bacterium]